MYSWFLAFCQIPCCCLYNAWFIGVETAGFLQKQTEGGLGTILGVVCYVLVANWNTPCENTAQCLLYNSVHIIYWARKFVSFLRWITENGSFLATWKNEWTFLSKSPNIYFFWYAYLFYILQFKILSPQNAKKKNTKFMHIFLVMTLQEKAEHWSQKTKF